MRYSRSHTSHACGSLSKLFILNVKYSLIENVDNLYLLPLRVEKYSIFTFTVRGQTCVSENDRIDCYPFEGVTESICVAKGCLYCSSNTAPSCHLPPNYGYVSDGNVVTIPGGYRVNLRRASNISYVGGDADEISIFFYTEYNERIRIKVTYRLI